MPPPTLDSILSRASSRNNVDEIGIESTKDILQAQVDSRIPVSPRGIYNRLPQTSILSKALLCQSLSMIKVYEHHEIFPSTFISEC